MNNRMTVIFYISIILNIAGLLLVALLIFRLGGFVYISEKITDYMSGSKKKQYPPYYWHKKSQFEQLPKSSSDIIMLGDSITDEGEWSELLSNINIKNRGISGDTVERILDRLDTILEAQPKQVFFMIGINDLVNEKKSVAETVAGYKQILNQFRLRSPKTQVFVQSVLPVNNKLKRFWQDHNKVMQLNLELQGLAKEFNYQYIDIFTHLVGGDNQLDAKYTVDGLHLKGEAYLIWKELIKSYI